MNFSCAVSYCISHYSYPIAYAKKFSRTRQVWNKTQRRNKLSQMLWWWRYKNSDIVHKVFLLSLIIARQLYAKESLHQRRHPVAAVVFRWMTEDITLILKYYFMRPCCICEDKYHYLHITSLNTKSNYVATVNGQYHEGGNRQTMLSPKGPNCNRDLHYWNRIMISSL